MSQPNQIQRLIELARSFRTAMFVTARPEGGYHARPMSIARVDDDGGVWFTTGRSTGKVDELAADADIAVIMQGRLQYVSLSGRARVIKDAAKARELWHEAFRAWFPGGPEDPELVLMHVHAVRGEYWDLSGARGLRYLIEAVRHAAARTRMPDASTDGRHAEVRFAHG